MAEASTSLLLIFDAPPQHGDSYWELLRRLHQEGVVPIGFSWHPYDGTNGRGNGEPAVRWAGEDPELRWQALRKILDDRSLDAIGFCGSAVFEQLAPRVLPHVQAPCFAYFPTKEERFPEAAKARWMRGARRLRLILADDKQQRERLERAFPRHAAFEIVDLSRGLGWIHRLKAGEARKHTLASLITPVFNRADYTLRCIESVRRNTTTPFEWIIVDNASSDSTPRELRKIAAKDRRIKIVRNERNLGFAPAVNQGLRKAKGDVLVVLNNDVIVPPGWLEGLVSTLDQDSGLGAAGPCTNQAADVHQHRHARYEIKDFDSFATAWAMRYAGRVREMHRLIGFCMALRREAVEQIGLLDERFRIGGYEDYDYSLRLRQAGWRLALVEQVFLHHFGHVSYKNDDAWLKTAEANREVFLDKWTRKSLEFLDDLSDLKAQSTW